MLDWSDFADDFYLCWWSVDALGIRHNILSKQVLCEVKGASSAKWICFSFPDRWQRGERVVSKPNGSGSVSLMNNIGVIQLSDSLFASLSPAIVIFFLFIYRGYLSLHSVCLFLLGLSNGRWLSYWIVATEAFSNLKFCIQ